MYDDGTFIIIRNNNAEQISGTYTNASNYIILTVDKSSGDSPKLELEVTDSGIKVESSDIGGYDPGDEGKLTEGTPPSGGQESPDSNISYSLGDAPKSDPLPENKYHIDEEISEGIYITFDIPKAENYWTTRVYIEGLGPVAEEVQYTDESKTKGCFFYPFVEAGKEYTIRFVFLRDEDRDEEGFVIDYKDDDGSLGWFQTKVKAGATSKGEVRFTSKGKIDVKKNGDFRFTEKPTFQNENLLGGKWEVEIGLVEGVSWEHGAERRTNWRTMYETIPSAELTKTINLYRDQKNERPENKYSIDFICVRPILYYEYNGTIYKYQWDSFVQDIFYPPRNPDGIYLEIDLPKNEFSRCDVMIDGIGKVAEEVKPLDESKTKGCFFYPFLEADKEYTIRFSFKKPEPVDGAGFTLPTPGDDTLTEVARKTTAGPRAKGEVRLLWENIGGLKADSECNILYFVKPKFENENLLGNKWLVEIGLMEGISWNHGDERRTKWHCAVAIPYTELTTISGSNKNLRDLTVTPRGDPCDHNHDIDCLCVRPIMLYEYGGKEYWYMWDSYTSDVHYPLNGQFEEIDINNSTDVAKIKGTWTQKGEWDETENFLAKVHVVWNETSFIDDSTIKVSYSYKYTKLNGSAFTKEELAGIVDYSDYRLIDSSEVNTFESELNQDANVLKFEKFLAMDDGSNQTYHYYIYKLDDEHNILSKDGKTLIAKGDYQNPLSMHFGNINQGERSRTYELKLSQDGSKLHVFCYGTDNGRYYEWTDIYYKQ